MALRCLELQIGNGAPLRQARAHFNCLHFVLFQHLLLLLISLALATSFLLPCSKPLTISAHPFALADPRGVLLILGFLLFFGFLFFFVGGSVIDFCKCCRIECRAKQHSHPPTHSQSHSQWEMPAQPFFLAFRIFGPGNKQACLWGSMLLNVDH